MDYEKQPFYTMFSVPSVYAIYSHGHWKLVDSEIDPEPLFYRANIPEVSTLHISEPRLTFISQIKTYLTSLRLRFF